MSARVVLGIFAMLAAGAASADEKVAPLTKVTAPTSAVASSSRSEPSPSFSKSQARPSNGSRSSGARPSGGSRSSGGARSSGATRSSGGSRSSGSRAARGPETGAQRRHPRPGTGTGYYDHGYYGGGYGNHYGGYYGGGYRGGYGNRYGRYYGYGRYGYRAPYYGYGYGYGYPWYGGYYASPYYSPYYYSGYYGYAPSVVVHSEGDSHDRDDGSVRLIVEPAKARVYVDGYYAGVVDEYDGVFQRLNLRPGRHDITLKLEGYRTQHFKVYIPVANTIKIRFDMVRGAGEATSEEFAGPPDAEYARGGQTSEEDRRREDDRDRDERREDGYYGSREPSRDPGDTGSVRLSVSPQDASVYVDGEFRGTGRQSSSLRLRPGRHRIEVVRPGFRTIERDVEIETGRSIDVLVELEKM